VAAHIFGIIQGAIGHLQASMTARYSRGTIGKSQTVEIQRWAHRMKLELEWGKRVQRKNGYQL
jgi:hypothetical protein